MGGTCPELPPWVPPELREEGRLRGRQKAEGLGATPSATWKGDYHVADGGPLFELLS